MVVGKLAKKKRMRGYPAILKYKHAAKNINKHSAHVAIDPQKYPHANSLLSSLSTFFIISILLMFYNGSR